MFVGLISWWIIPYLVPRAVSLLCASVGNLSSFSSSFGPHPPNDVERSLFALPAHLGGLGIFNPSEIALTTYQFSRQLAGPIVECVL